MDRSELNSFEADILHNVRKSYEKQIGLIEKALEIDEVPQYLQRGVEMKGKNLEDYLLTSDMRLWANFRDGEQGREDFSQFMNLVRKQQEENKQLKRFIENNELDLLMEFKDYFPEGMK